MAKSISAAASEILLSERLRVSSILESPEGIARPKAALELALRTSLESQSAIDLLKSFPIDNPYLRALDLEGPVNLSSLGAAPGGISDDKKAKRLAELATNLAPMKKKS
ncbi:hypothetical protein V1281_002633 [Nitrobacteraceae bacterium AZCC 2161]